jgi:hypothetical protein
MQNTAGFCRDGLNHGMQLHCYKALRQPSGVCAESRPTVRVHSIDGSSHLEKTMNKIIRAGYWPPVAKEGEDAAAAAAPSSVGAMWRYYHYAASDRRGTARFTKQGAGAKQGAGFEGGQIRKDASEDTEEVPAPLPVPLPGPVPVHVIRTIPPCRAWPIVLLSVFVPLHLFPP